MVTQTRTMAPPAMMPARSSGNIITQIFRVFVHPRAFFKNVPTGSSWLLAALLVLAITGYAATQMRAGVETDGNSVTPITSFDPSTMQMPSGADAGTGDQATTGGFTPNVMQMPSGAETTGGDAVTGGFDLEALNERLQAQRETPGFLQNAVDTTATSNQSPLTTALLAGTVQVAFWLGQAVVLSLVPMLGGHAPKFGHSLQIAVWASLPLALMLVLRAISFTSGGEGGALGVSALLDQWDGFASLPELAQTVVTVFAANLTLFWLWSLVLMYFGARYGLNGGRLAATLVVAMWIVGSTVGTALAGGIPTTSIPVVVAAEEDDGNTGSNGNTAGQLGGADTFSFGGANGGVIQVMPGGDGTTFSARPLPAFGGQTGGGG